jgi:hypothetical protein
VELRIEDAVDNEEEELVGELEEDGGRHEGRHVEEGWQLFVV